MVHTVFLPFRSSHGTDEENLFIIKDPLFLILNNNVLLFLELLCLINLSDVLPFKP